MKKLRINKSQRTIINYFLLIIAGFSLCMLAFNPTMIVCNYEGVNIGLQFNMMAEYFKNIVNYEFFYILYILAFALSVAVIVLLFIIQKKGKVNRWIPIGILIGAGVVLILSHIALLYQFSSLTEIEILKIFPSLSQDGIESLSFSSALFGCYGQLWLVFACAISYMVINLTKSNAIYGSLDTESEKNKNKNIDIVVEEESEESKNNKKAIYFAIGIIGVVLSVICYFIPFIKFNTDWYSSSDVTAFSSLFINFIQFDLFYCDVMIIANILIHLAIIFVFITSGFMIYSYFAKKDISVAIKYISLMPLLFTILAAIAFTTIMTSYILLFSVGYLILAIASIITILVAKHLS